MTEQTNAPITFSVIVVCLNPGNKLNQTLDSILCQTYDNYEIVVKDGGSRDSSTETMRQDSHIRLFTENDTGIYDAMNQAVAHAEGDYVLFLNCGDVFYEKTVLERTAGYIEQVTSLSDSAIPYIFYGDTYSEKNDVLITASPKITGFTCYRNIPCHQSCFYATSLCKNKPYDKQFRIRADYDHFLWCYYKAKARMVHMPITIASYEGGGYSESKENQERDKEEHREITRTYMGKGELFWYHFIMALTLAPLRRAMAENRFFAGVYHKCKEIIYH